MAACVRCLVHACMERYLAPLNHYCFFFLFSVFGPMPVLIAAVVGHKHKHIMTFSRPGSLLVSCHPAGLPATLQWIGQLLRFANLQLVVGGDGHDLAVQAPICADGEVSPVLGSAFVRSLALADLPT
eukprot:m.450981 g.450981  ORF g.450981 m.450981 type:complete len:127 (+) comp20322_c0_seq34:532-912(+)